MEKNNNFKKREKKKNKGQSKVRFDTGENLRSENVTLSLLQ